MLAGVQKILTGQKAIFAFRPAGKFCLKDPLGAKFTFQGDAKSAPRVSANFARDSYHYY